MDPVTLSISGLQTSDEGLLPPPQPSSSSPHAQERSGRISMVAHTALQETEAVVPQSEVRERTERPIRLLDQVDLDHLNSEEQESQRLLTQVIRELHWDKEEYSRLPLRLVLLCEFMKQYPQLRQQVTSVSARPKVRVCVYDMYTIARILHMACYDFSGKEEIDVGVAFRAAIDLVQQMPQVKWFQKLPLFLRSRSFMSVSIDHLLSRAVTRPSYDIKNRSFQQIAHTYTAVFDMSLLLVHPIVSRIVTINSCDDVPQPLAQSGSFRKLWRLLSSYQKTMNPCDYYSLNQKLESSLGHPLSYKDLLVEKAWRLKFYKESLKKVLEEINQLLEMWIPKPAYHVFSEKFRIMLEGNRREVESISSLDSVLFLFLEEDLFSPFLTISDTSSWNLADLEEELLEVRQTPTPEIQKHVRRRKRGGSHTVNPTMDMSVETVPSACVNPLLPAPMPLDILLHRFREGQSISDSFKTLTVLHESCLMDHFEKDLVKGRIFPDLGHCREKIHLVRHSLFEMSQNLHLFVEAFRLRQLRLLPALFSSLLQNWHVAIEQYLSILYILQHNERSSDHSLDRLSRSVGTTLSPRFLEIDNALLWYRYPVFFLRRHPRASSKGLFLMDLCQRMAGHPEQATGRNISELIDFVVNMQKEVFTFIYGVLYQQKTTFEPILRSSIEKIDGIRTELCHIAMQDPFPPPHGGPLYDALRPLRDFFRAYGDGMSNDLRMTMEEYIQHVERMEGTLELIDLIPDPAMSSVHLRRLLNIQWMTEQFYIVQLLLKDHSLVYAHTFSSFEEVLALGETSLSEPIRSLLNMYNHGKYVHYETHYHDRGIPSPLSDLCMFVSSCMKSGTCVDGFHPVAESFLSVEGCRERLLHRREDVRTLILRETEILTHLLHGWHEKQVS